MNKPEAEAKWRKAWKEHMDIGTVETLRAEEAAWDTYVTVCELGELCEELGCTAVSGDDYGYCPKHRVL